MTKEMMDKLSKPFLREQISLRVGSLTKNKEKAIPLAYIDARDVMQRLDEAVGCENWKDEYVFIGSRNMCKLSVRIGDEWVYKMDGAADTNIEGEKGGISDAFKRAAVKWGVGRELYKYKFRYAPVDTFKKFVDNDAGLWEKYLLTGSATLKEVEQPTVEEQVVKITSTLEKWLSTVDSVERLLKMRKAKETIDLENKLLQLDEKEYKQMLKKYTKKEEQLND
jgi:hypothetical protein